MDNEFVENVIEEVTTRKSTNSALIGFAGGIVGAITYQTGKIIVSKLKNKLSERKRKSKIEQENIDLNADTIEE